MKKLSIVAFLLVTGVTLHTEAGLWKKIKTACKSKHKKIIAASIESENSIMKSVVKSAEEEAKNSIKNLNENHPKLEPNSDVTYWHIYVKGKGLKQFDHAHGKTFIGLDLNDPEFDENDVEYHIHNLKSGMTSINDPWMYGFLLRSDSLRNKRKHSKKNERIARDVRDANKNKLENIDGFRQAYKECLGQLDKEKCKRLISAVYKCCHQREIMARTMLDSTSGWTLFDWWYNPPENISPKIFEETNEEEV